LTRGKNTNQSTNCRLIGGNRGITKKQAAQTIFQIRQSRDPSRRARLRDDYPVASVMLFILAR